MTAVRCMMRDCSTQKDGKMKVSKTLTIDSQLYKGHFGSIFRTYSILSNNSRYFVFQAKNVDLFSTQKDD